MSSSVDISAKSESLSFWTSHGVGLPLVTNAGVTGVTGVTGALTNVGLQTSAMLI